VQGHSKWLDILLTSEPFQGVWARRSRGGTGALRSPLRGGAPRGSLYRQGPGALVWRPGAVTLTVATIASMAERRLIAAISPPKPINQMTAAEKAQFVNEVVTQIAVKLKKGEGS